MSDRILVAGVGNELRRDDGIGSAVIAELRSRNLDGVETTALDGEPARLVEAWDGAGLAVLVDACTSGAAPGTVHRVEGPSVAPLRTPASSHGAGVAEAVRLGAVLGRLPRRLVILAVEGADFEPGQGLSDPVRNALPEVLGLLRQELADHQGCAL